MSYLPAGGGGGGGHHHHHHGGGGGGFGPAFMYPGYGYGGGYPYPSTEVFYVVAPPDEDDEEEKKKKRKKKKKAMGLGALSPAAQEMANKLHEMDVLARQRVEAKAAEERKQAILAVAAAALTPFSPQPKASIKVSSEDDATKKTNWLLYGGIGVGVLVLVLALK